MSRIDFEPDALGWAAIEAGVDARRHARRCPICAAAGEPCAVAVRLNVDAAVAQRLYQTAAAQLI